MTQAFNLSQFANKLNSSGQTDNTGLQNSAVTVTAGTGMSGGGSVALGSSVTLTNAGVTSLNSQTGAVSVVAGSGISVSASGGNVTVSSSGGAGTVTSVATGNGLSGGTITTSGTLSVACPTFNTVGSYAHVLCWSNGDYIYSGSNYSAGNGTFQMQTISIRANNPGVLNTDPAAAIPTDYSNNLSGTWKWMGSQAYLYAYNIAIACRVS